MAGPTVIRPRVRVTGRRAPATSLPWTARPFVLVGVILAASLVMAGAFVPLVAGAGIGAKSLADRISQRFFAHSDLHIPRFPERSVIYAADGSTLARPAFENRRVIPLRRMSVPARRAVLAIEDYQFFHHGGVDLRAIVRAAVENLQAGRVTQGGSTITQQLVKNLTGHRAATLGRKIREAYLANRLEERYSKKDILRMYLNGIYLGNGAYGLEAAAETYFREHARELTLPQGAMIAGLIANPSLYDPIQRPRNALRRRNTVLARMAEIHWIPRERARRLMTRPLGLAKGAGEPPPINQPFWVQFVRRLIEEDPNHQFRALGRTVQQRTNALFAGGLQIYTTLNPTWQNYALSVIRQQLPSPADPESAVATVEPGTGAIRVLVSGRNFAKTHQDIVTGLDGHGMRQEGSSFKPYTLVAAFREGIPPGKVYPSYSPATDLVGPCNGWSPYNAEGGGDLGYMNLYKATALSINAVFGRLAADVGAPNIARAAEDMGLHLSHDPGPEDCSITLGTFETSPLDMATGYATLANDGIYCPYYAVERIVAANGRTIYQHHPERTCRRTVSSDIAAQVTDMLKGVVDYGTGTAAKFSTTRPLVGKTGTTNDFGDAWFVGYVRQLSTAVWVGYVQRHAMYGVEGFDEVYGGTIPALEWHDIMAKLTQGLSFEGFPAPPPPPAGQVPNVVGKSLDEAEAILAEANLTPIVGDEVPSTLPKGTVAAQSPGGGTTVQLGSIVTLSVSTGKPPRPKVPDVLGLSAEDATAALEARGFVVDETFKAVHRHGLDGIVLAQDPEAGIKAQYGSTVTIVVGKFQKGKPSPSPSPSRSPKPKPSKSPKPHPTKTKKG